jgi:hypothetical protein
MSTYKRVSAATRTALEKASDVFCGLSRGRSHVLDSGWRPSCKAAFDVETDANYRILELDYVSYWGRGAVRAKIERLARDPRGFRFVFCIDEDYENEESFRLESFLSKYGRVESVTKSWTDSRCAEAVDHEFERSRIADVAFEGYDLFPVAEPPKPALVGIPVFSKAAEAPIVYGPNPPYMVETSVRGDLLSALEEAKIVFDGLVSTGSNLADLPNGWTQKTGENRSMLYKKFLDRHGPPCAIRITRFESGDEFVVSVEVRPGRSGEYSKVARERAESRVTKNGVVAFSDKESLEKSGELDRTIAASSVAWMFPDEP